MLPSKRQKQRSGIERGPKREWLRHRRFVRSLGCCIPNCITQPTEFCHIRTAANSGTGLKPFDWNAVGMCRIHHQESHDMGSETFQKRYGVDFERLAAEYVKASPDRAMKDAMREAGKMPDISMCPDDACPSSRICYRHEHSGTKPCELRQAYMDFSREPGADQCSRFWSVAVARAVGETD